MPLRHTRRMQIWQTIVYAIGGAVGVVAGLAWLVRVFTEHFLASKLAESSFAFQTRFARLHEKRAEIIQTLYSKLVDIDERLHAKSLMETEFHLFPPKADLEHNTLTQELKGLRSALMPLLAELRLYIIHHKLFFSEGLNEA